MADAADSVMVSVDELDELHTYLANIEPLNRAILSY